MYEASRAHCSVTGGCSLSGELLYVYMDSNFLTADVQCQLAGPANLEETTTRTIVFVRAHYKHIRIQEQGYQLLYTRGLSV